MTILSYHELADIRLRLALGETKREDVEYLLDCVDRLRDKITEYDGVELSELVDLRTEVREHEAFERGLWDLVNVLRVHPAAGNFLRGEPLAVSCEVCSMCSEGLVDEYGFCPHGKKIRGLYAEVAAGPTQTGFVVLVVFVLPLLRLFPRPTQKPAIPARKVRNARRAL